MLVSLVRSTRFLLCVSLFSLSASLLSQANQTPFNKANRDEQNRRELAQDYGKAAALSARLTRQMKHYHTLQDARRAPDLRNSSAEPLLSDIMSSPDTALSQVLLWNKAALDITAIDHDTQPGNGLTADSYAEQVGPARTSRAMAIVHLAIFETVNMFEQKYESYHDMQMQIMGQTNFRNDQGDAHFASEDMAIARAAYSTLIALYPKKKAYIDAQFLGPDAAQIQADAEARFPAPGAAASYMAKGSQIGDMMALAVMNDRAGDSSELPDGRADQFLPVDGPSAGLWQKDPLNKNSVALGSNWSLVRPFLMQSADQFRPAPPPTQGSPEYQAAVAYTKSVGGDPDAVPGPDRQPTPTQRTDEETYIGQFWAYDGTAMLCAPPRLYNMIATSIATNEKINETASAIEMARLLATINIAMADAGIAAWESKYFYLNPRPVTAIRGNDDSSPFWTPLGAPITNGTTRNLTPPFPSYPSGHATFGATLFEVLSRFYNTPLDSDRSAFVFVSDEYNGVNIDPRTGQPRPLQPRHLASFATAEQENADSRMYLGIHWPFDATAGINQGHLVADYVYDHVFRPLGQKARR